MCVCRLTCAAVKEDEPQLTDRGVEKVEHPFPSLLQSLAFSSSAPSRLRRMPVQHHLGVALASLSTQAIRMNEVEMRHYKADTHKSRNETYLACPLTGSACFREVEITNSSNWSSSFRKQKEEEKGWRE